MKELKDIVLKEGDRVYYEESDGNADSMVITASDGSFASELFMVYKITKIERPVKYEIIYEAPKQILDKEEKEYLEAVIRPFKDRVSYMYKKNYHDGLSQYLKIYFGSNSDDYMIFPNFPKDTMYKGMEVDKEYTLKELGLFE